jgi:hypothetical protein
MVCKERKGSDILVQRVESSAFDGGRVSLEIVCLHHMRTGRLDEIPIHEPLYCTVPCSLEVLGAAKVVLLLFGGRILLLHSSQGASADHLQQGTRPRGERLPQSQAALVVALRQLSVSEARQYALDPRRPEVTRQILHPRQREHESREQRLQHRRCRPHILLLFLSSIQRQPGNARSSSSRLLRRHRRPSPRRRSRPRERRAATAAGRRGDDRLAGEWKSVAGDGVRVLEALDLGVRLPVREDVEEGADLLWCEGGGRCWPRSRFFRGRRRHAETSWSVVNRELGVRHGRICAACLFWMLVSDVVGREW